MTIQPPARIALIGDPVAHSRSPAMQNAALAHMGINAIFELWHTPHAALATRMAELRNNESVWGVNVTLPHKTAVISFLDELEPEAAAIGAVNTIYKRDGRLIGANTDAPGLLDDLREAGEFHPVGQRVVVLGASGAARAAAYALFHAGISHMVIANRTAQRAHNLVADIHAHAHAHHHVEPLPPVPSVVAIALDNSNLPHYIAEATLLLNATSIGWHGDETPYPHVPVSPGTLVYDMVYRHTRLLQDAEQRGARTLQGIGMLVRQGALAFTRWTGQPAPLDIMFHAVEM